MTPGVAAAPVPVTTPMGANDPTSQPYDLSVTQGRSAFEITPMVAYIFGGGFDTDALDDVPPGSLSLRSGIGYGAEIGFTPNGRLWFEGTFMRQTTDITFIPDPGFSAPLTSSGFATNYIHGGARYEFGDRNVHPFLGLGRWRHDLRSGPGQHRQQHELLPVRRGRCPHDDGEG